MSGSHEWAVELAAFGKSYAGGWTGSRRWAARGISLLTMSAVSGQGVDHVLEAAWKHLAV